MDNDPRADRTLTLTISSERPMPAFEMHGISKRFGSVDALDSVSLSAKPRTIHALLGENGAGKTTLMRIAFGMIQPDSGWLSVAGTRTSFSSPADAIAAGIGMVHQQFSLVMAMSVVENIALGGRGRYNRQEIIEQIERVAGKTGLRIDPDARVADLNSAERQKVEILRTLAHDARVLILDEPTAVLTSHDTEELFRQLRVFGKSGGTVILITHKLRDVLAHADEVTVLRRGRVVLTTQVSHLDASSLTEAMIGTTSTSVVVSSDRNVREGTRTVASLRGVMLGPDESAVDLQINAGEILGVAALDGSAGQLLRLLGGRIEPRSGYVDHPDQIGFVPENRQDEAIIPSFSLTENFALRSSGMRHGRLDWKQMKKSVTDVVRDFDVVAEKVSAAMSELSGGNQQRFVLGRELDGNPSLLVLENPTHGLDVKAAASVHDRMRRARDRGTAVVFYSSDLDELAELADRVLVVSASRLCFAKPQREAIGSLLLEGESRRDAGG